MAGKEVFNENDIGELIGDIEALDSNVVHKVFLRRLTVEGKFNEGENYLFEILEKQKTKGILDIGKEFYENLSKKSDEELEKGDFSREEILQGLEDLDLLYKEI